MNTPRNIKQLLAQDDQFYKENEGLENKENLQP